MIPTSAPAVAAAFARARDAQTRWAATPVTERCSILGRVGDLVLDRQNEILDLMQAENGKTRRDAFLEVSDIAITSRYYARTAPRLLAPHRRRGAIPGLTRTTEVRHPKGTVAVISPWNYPLSMAAGDAIPALIAGNAVVQKPDTQTALSALWALEIAREAGLPDDVWQMVVGRGRDIGGTIVDNADYVMFTGSTASGRTIARDAGERLIGASLELVAILPFFSGLLALSVIDLRTFRLPDRVNLPLLLGSIPLIVVISLVQHRPDDLMWAAIGGVGYWLLLGAMWFVYPRGMGYGDVKLARVLGLYLGWVHVALPIYGLMFAGIGGSVAGIAMLAITRNRKQGFPFGPWLAAGTVLAIMLSESLTRNL
mgnify:CR=1 FL=1